MSTLEFTEYVLPKGVYGAQLAMPRGQESTTQQVTIQAASTLSNAFGSGVGMIEITGVDVDCRVAIGGSTVAAVNSGSFSRRLRAGGTYRFAVEPGQYLAVIAMEGGASAPGATLPSGAATAAKQPALGTAGTPSADVITTQDPTSNIWSYAAANLGIVNSTTAVTLAAAAGAGVRNFVSSLQVDWEALGTATEIAIRDGAAGTVKWRSKIPANVAGVREIVFPKPIRGSANTLLEFVTLTASGTGAVYVNAQGFTGA